MYRRQVRRRRGVLVALIVSALVLLSLHFAEADSGPLHTIQRGVATVFSPVEEVASSALKPARDLVNWFDETFDARGENDDLREEVVELRGELADAQEAVGENTQFRKLLQLDEEGTLDAYAPVTARVIGRSPTVWYSTVTVNAGSRDGVEVNDSVVGPGGHTGALVGRVTAVTSGSAQVELLTDHRNAVTAKVLPDGPEGIVEAEAGDPDDLVLDFIENGDDVQQGDILVTAGWSNGSISSAYPYGIEIGTVAEASTGDQDFQRITVEPFVEMKDLQYVRVLTGGPDRPGVPG